VAPLLLTDQTRTLIHRLKFSCGLAETRILAALIAGTVEQRYADQPLPGVLIPVPLSTRRLLYRGYNQAVLLGRFISRFCGIPLIRTGIRRQHRPLQQSLSAKERIHNLQDAFYTRRAFDGTVAIVDDILTTGATASEMSRLLRHCGASQVHLWCAASTPPVQPSGTLPPP
jgi:ComF family protein